MRRVALVALGFVALAAALVSYKVLELGYELSPLPADDRWSVQTEVRIEGAASDARVSFFLPADGPRQRIYDERVTAEGMRFFIRPRGRNRMGMAVGSPVGPGISYRFSLQTVPAPDEPLPASSPPLSVEEAKRLADELGPDEAIQSDDPAVAKLLEELAVERGDPAGAVRLVHDFVVRELELSDGHDGPQDAAAVLERERGGGEGKVRAEVALLRAAGVPARVVVGVPISEGADKPLVRWAEARLSDAWWPLDPLVPAPGVLPEPRLVLHLGDAPHLEGSRVDAVSYRVSMLRETRSHYLAYQRKLARSDKLLDQLSLFALPVKAQVLMRLLLLLPFGALVVAVFRNLVGVPTFGTFMPILIALAFRESGIGWGFLLLAFVIAFGWVGRFLLDRAQLLMVPRLSFLLTLVILIMTAVVVVAEHLGSDRALSIALFPIVILTMTIERLSITLVEEGPRNAAKVVAGTVVVSVAGYLVIVWERLQLLIFTFPELHLVTLGALLVLGRYTGYRLSEWLRFRAFRRGGVERA